MATVLEIVQNHRDLHTFMHLPVRLHARDAHWMPPLFAQEKAFFDPAKNKAYAYCDTRLWLAFRDGQACGRIMGIVHHPYNEQHAEKNARFFMLDCDEDEALCHALLDTAEQWARSLGMTRMVGPFGFSGRDSQGLLVEGFDQMPIMGTPCNPPYLPRFVERKGYEKLVDCLDYLIDIQQGIPEVYPKIFERVKRNTQFELLEFRRRRDMKPFIVPVFRLINRAYEGLYGFTALNEQEMHELAERYLPVLDPRFLKVIRDESGEVVAFMLGMPNMTAGIRRAGGKLFPFGFLFLLHAARTTTQLNLALGAIDHRYRGRGLDILMGWSMIESARAAGINTFETNLVLETNMPMRAEYERVGAQLHKRFRIYQKEI